MTSTPERLNKLFSILKSFSKAELNLILKNPKHTVTVKKTKQTKPKINVFL